MTELHLVDRQLASRLVFKHFLSTYEQIDGKIKYIMQIHIFLPFSLCSGVGNALEGGRGRAGTKLFQDFQMLSRIWTHPWCLQLDYISKENRVGLRKTRLNHTNKNLKTGNTFVQITYCGNTDRWSNTYCHSSNIFPLSIISATWEPVLCLVHFDRSTNLTLIHSCRVTLTRTVWTNLLRQKPKNPQWVWPLRTRRQKSKIQIIFFFVCPNLTAHLQYIFSSCWLFLLYHSSSLLGKRSKAREKRGDLMTRTVMMWRSSKSGTPALVAEMGRVETEQSL